MLNVAEGDPNAVAENTHELSVVNTVKPSAKLGDAVSTVSVTAEDDHLSIMPVSDRILPLNVGCLFWTTKVKPVVTVTPVSKLDTAVTVTAELESEHIR